ncbi:hypothetical protein RCL1_006375 [Eukaryota sp. TZLM3-RCL]
MDPTLSIVGGKAIDLIADHESSDIHFLTLTLSTATLPFNLSEQFLHQNPRFQFSFQLFGYLIKSQDFSTLDTPKLPTVPITFALRCPRDLFIANLPPLDVNFLALSSSNTLLATTTFNLSSLASAAFSLSSTSPFVTNQPHLWLSNPALPSNATITLSLSIKFKQTPSPTPSIPPSTLSLPSIPPPSNPNIPPSNPSKTLQEVDEWKRKEKSKLRDQFIAIENTRLRQVEEEFNQKISIKLVDFDLRLKKLDAKEKSIEEAINQKQSQMIDFDTIVASVENHKSQAESSRKKLIELEAQKNDLVTLLGDLKNRTNSGKIEELKRDLNQLSNNQLRLDSTKNQLVLRIDHLNSSIAFLISRIESVKLQLQFQQQRADVLSSAEDLLVLKTALTHLKS